MNFTPGCRPIGLNAGATSCILNHKEDFIDFTPVKNTVLKSISSDLSIEGCGTICWKITDDLGDEISLHIHDSLYVPQAPMCLLSPQSVAQQTTHTNDGFHVKSQHGIFTFAGFQKTIYYNSDNNLSIFFTSTDLHTIPSSFSDTSSHTEALLSSTILDDNLSPLQCQLLHKQLQLGHLFMTRKQDLAKQDVFGDHNI
jgi:hypothetical protein